MKWIYDKNGATWKSMSRDGRGYCVVNAEKFKGSYRIKKSVIKKSNKVYFLTKIACYTLGPFKKLKSAKTVGDLIENG